ncbi:MAG: universal stress protein [Flavobacteriales bacterium]|jgi:nucleotide-binding universal stress UspA family protein|nr:MAG: universal stress protein [Flavobacteriales bacterium]
MARILIPTDFSSNALSAAVYAIRLHGVEGNRFVLLNTYMMPHGAASTMWNMDDLLAREALAGVKAFAEVVRKAVPEPGLELDAVAEHGDLPNVIDRYRTDAERPAMVVMGTQGASGLQEVLFGSNTASVIKQGAFPVLAVPAKAVYRAPKRILLADDGGPVDRETLAPAIELARWNHGEIRVVRVITERKPAESTSSGTPYDALFGAIPHSLQYISGENVESALNDLAEQGDADLLVVLHRKRGIFQGLFHRSTAAALAMHTHLPLLVLQQADR